MYNFESSGNASIVIKATSSINILGVNYVEGDVVAIFDNAFFNLGFRNNNKGITQGAKNLLNFNTMALDSIEIEAKSLSYSYYNFIAVNKIHDQDFLAPVKEKINSDENGMAFFNRIPSNSKPVFIKNTNLENQTGYTIDYTTGQITGLAANENFISFYYYPEVSLVSYGLEKVETPYFKIEITGENNVNGISRFMFIEIPKASINIQTTLNFTQNNLTAPDLIFSIIDGLGKVIYY
jgi:hypothetical protein